MTSYTLLSKQSLLGDRFGPILIESFSLEEIKIQKLPFIKVMLIEWHNIAVHTKQIKWLDFVFEKTTQQSSQPQTMSLKPWCPSEKKNLTRQLNSYCWLEFQVFVSTFTSRTLSKTIGFWICEDQNDLSYTAQHAKPLGGQIWSNFDWKFQSRKDQNPKIALGMW